MKFKNKYLTLLCLTVAMVAPESAWCDMQAARALRPINGVAPVKVQVSSTSESITLQYVLPLAMIVSLGEEGSCPRGTCTKKRVSVGNAPMDIAEEGLPILPVIPAIVIIPSGKAIDNIQVTRNGETVIGSEYFIEFGERIIPGSCDDCVGRATYNSAIYSSDNAFPQTAYSLAAVQKKCGVSIAYVNLNPVTYYPLSGRVASYSSISLVINLKDGTGGSDPVVCRPERIIPQRLGIENPEALATYSSGPSTDNYQYVIITNTAINNWQPPDPQMDKTVHDLLQHRVQKCGLTARIVTVDDPVTGIYSNYPGIDNAEKVRNFITYAYNNWKTEYVLLAGDIDVIPVRYLWGNANTNPPIPDPNKYIPSDLYFQCLDGPFNNDGDDKWGETNDGQNGADVDLLAEVHIGRASAENPQEMSNFIYKVLSYENDVLSYTPGAPGYEYLDNALMVGEKLYANPYYSKPFMEEIRLGTSNWNYKTKGFASSTEYTVNTLYDQDKEEQGLPPWDEWELRGQHIMANRHSILNHLGHSLVNYNMKMWVDDAIYLRNTKFLFLYSQGCYAGSFDNKDVDGSTKECIGETYTTSTTLVAPAKDGMWGAVLNSRYGLIPGFPFNTNGPSQHFNREFWHSYISKGILNVGAINADAREAWLYKASDRNMRWCYYVINLLGDPYSFLKDPIRCELILNAGTFRGTHELLARKLLSAGGTVIVEKDPVSNISDVTFISGREIRLLPNFQVKNGANFKAYIDPSLYKSSCN